MEIRGKKEETKLKCHRGFNNMKYIHKKGNAFERKNFKSCIEERLRFFQSICCLCLKQYTSL